MTGFVYTRFAVERPPHLSNDQWACASSEVARLDRSINANDGAQVLGDLKCLVEAIARIVLDLAGTPADASDAFTASVKRAHELLAGQPGHDLTNAPAFARMASQANRIAQNLGEIRNEFGTGHGRARQPDFEDEMVLLALDGGLLWTRWALRRVGYFAMGRPVALINDLVVDVVSFYSGSLAERLRAANLPNLDPRHQRSIGIAVGQRVMRDTFVVRWDGLDPCLASSDLNEWPSDYRRLDLRALVLSRRPSHAD